VLSCRKQGHTPYTVWDRATHFSMSAQRLKGATHAVMRFVPVAAEADTLLRVC